MQLYEHFYLHIAVVFATIITSWSEFDYLCFSKGLSFPCVQFILRVSSRARLQKKRALSGNGEARTVYI